jgi:hypothetical protein
LALSKSGGCLFSDEAKWEFTCWKYHLTINTCYIILSKLAQKLVSFPSHGIRLAWVCLKQPSNWTSSISYESYPCSTFSVFFRVTTLGCA